MPESAGLPNPPELFTTTRQMLAVAQMSVHRDLTAHLDVAGLELVRRRLKDADLVQVCATGPVAEYRADTLDSVCRALAARGFAPLAYFEGIGDVFSHCPDGPDALVFPGGDGVE